MVWVPIWFTETKIYMSYIMHLHFQIFFQTVPMVLSLKAISLIWTSVFKITLTAVIWGSSLHIFKNNMWVNLWVENQGMSLFYRWSGLGSLPSTNGQKFMLSKTRLFQRWVSNMENKEVREEWKCLQVIPNCYNKHLK